MTRNFITFILSQVHSERPSQGDEKRRKSRNEYKILVGKPERKRPIGRPRYSCVNNIKMDLREIGWGGMD
jgi:hypothetical protein